MKSFSHIAECCNGIIKSSGGYHWRYATKEESLKIKKKFCIDNNLNYDEIQQEKERREELKDE